MIGELKKNGCHSRLLKSLREGREIPKRAGMVGIYDTDCVSNRDDRHGWVERDKYFPGTPLWVTGLSTYSCVGICHDAVTSSSNLKRTMHEIAKRFLYDFREEETPDEIEKKEKERKERLRRLAPLTRKQHPDRPREHFMLALEPRRKVGHQF